MNIAEEKRNRLREGLESPSPVVAVGAHDAMSAQLIESHGFDAVWVSGFGVSTMAHALPDLNLTTMTETVAAAARADAAVRIPVIVDCDNGFGALTNLVRTVREFERAGIAAICVEDNTFPKRNSLYTGESQRALIPAAEQSRRIRAAKAAQESETFVFIARVEALIAGLGVAEACDRADAYVEAGADAILIHSRDKSLGEIEGFLEKWRGVGEVPLVAVPTLFPTFSVDELHDKGFQVIIFANQPMRAAVQGMEDTLHTLRRERRAASVDADIASVNHVFDLVRTKEMIELEEGPEPQG
ncbi:MAG: isocitrate lyase/phosphoenolpyruvate mutase family protein [Actinomycetota bacterium]|nr:isocitrate lyase/phosphoenolpyruvate mutase family protein [Actinomycetota bacterium]